MLSSDTWNNLIPTHGPRTNWHVVVNKIGTGV